MRVPLRLVLPLFLAAKLGAQRGDAPDARPLAGDAEQRLFHLPPGFEIQLVASEPDIQKPINLNFDSAGRVWVTGSDLYPWPATVDAKGEPIASYEKNFEANQLAFRGAVSAPKPSDRGSDTVRVLSDFDPETGRARKVTTFVDGLNIPVGVLPLPRRPGARGDTAIVYSIPSIWRFEDTDGDGRADKRERLFSEFGFKDTHGMASNFTLWIDGWVYGNHGFSNRSEITDGSGQVTVLNSGNTYRFRPDGSHFEIWANGQTNPFGLAFDPRGDIYTADSHSKPVYLLVHGGYYEGINKKHDGLGFAPSITLDDHGSSAIAGVTYYAATQFPEEYRGNLFNGNPVTRRVNRDRLEWSGSTPKAVRMPDFLSSDDPTFRPVQVKLGPDGALWIADFCNPIIGHYEVPLTHPSRDHQHGRIWRIVYRGENGAVPAPPPNFAGADAAALVAKLRDDNLVVRTLAANELTARVAAPQAKAALPARADGLPDHALLPLAFVRERLGAPDDAQLLAPLASATTDSDAALVALRVLAARPNLGTCDEKFFAALIERTAPGHLWRATTDVFTTHPQGWQGRLLLAMLARTPKEDRELTYALRLALKTVMSTATLADLQALAAVNADAADAVADVATAVDGSAPAEFLLGYLQQRKFAVPRAGEFARQAVMELPADRFDALQPLVASMASASVPQQLALAEGLAAVGRLPGRTLPAPTAQWMQETLVAAFAASENPIANRAIDATKKLAFAGKTAALREVAENGKRPAAVRVTAVKALDPDAAGLEALASVAARRANPLNVRRAAVDQLSTFAVEADAAFAGEIRRALVAALPGAPYDMAVAIATGLAKTDAGAEELLAQIDSGKAPATLLRHRYVSSALEKRPDRVRAHVAELAKNLPSEDARLDAIIAARAGAYAPEKASAAHGAQVFAQYCAACHRIRSAGGNIGPSLDGVGSRGLQRVIEDILDPSRNVDPMFRVATVTLKSGEARTGMNLREEGDNLVLTDPATAQDIVVPKADVAAKSVSATSPMPPSFDTVIPENDFRDLLSYLLEPST